MDFWKWLLTPEGLPLLIAFVGVLSGVIGGVTSQLIAGIFSRSRDTRQMKASSEQFYRLEERWKSEQDFARQQLLLTTRREVYTRFLRLMQAQADGLRTTKNKRTEGMTNLVNNTRELNTAIQELVLFDQEVFNAAGETFGALPRLDELTSENYSEKMKAFKEANARMIYVMQKSLGIVNMSKASHTQPQLNEAPVRDKEIEPGKSNTT